MSETRNINVRVTFHETGAVSIDHIRYGPTLLVSRLFNEMKRKLDKGRKKK